MTLDEILEAIDQAKNRFVTTTAKRPSVVRMPVSVYRALTLESAHLIELGAESDKIWFNGLFVVADRDATEITVERWEAIVR